MYVNRQRWSDKRNQIITFANLIATDCEEEIFAYFDKIQQLRKLSSKTRT